MTDLSSAAQAILDAYQFAPIEDELTAAAVLRAAADQMGYSKGPGGFVVDVDDLNAIADELEATQ